MKVPYVQFYNYDPTVPQIDVQPLYDTGSSSTFINWTQDLSGCHTYEDIRQVLNAAIIANAPSTITEIDIQYPGLSPRSAPRSFATPSRSLNSNFTISSTRNARVVYSINASWNLAALLSGTGTAFLEYSLDAGSTWITQSQVSKTLNLLTVAGADDMNLCGDIPAGALVRIRTTATNMTITLTRSAEVLD